MLRDKELIFKNKVAIDKHFNWKQWSVNISFYGWIIFWNQVCNPAIWSLAVAYF